MMKAGALMLKRDRRGSAAVEFAVLSMPLSFLLFGALDVGYQLYASSVVQGTVFTAGRKATLENADRTVIDAFVRQQLVRFAASDKIKITATSYRAYSGVSKPEKITTDTGVIGTVDAIGDCWIDSTKNDKYDSSQGSAGIGGAEDIVIYKVEMDYPYLTPIPNALGFGKIGYITRTTTLKNEPYAGVIDPPTVCKKS